MNRNLNLKFLIVVWLMSFFCLYAQAQDQTVSINVKNASLRQVFKEIEKQTSYRFSYRDAIIDSRNDISVSFKATPVPRVLDAVLQGRNLSYSIVSKNSIVVTDILSTVSQTRTGQRAKVSGRVLDEQGEPLIGATVMLKGSSNGTVTDYDGYFTLQNVENDDLLEISYIGFASQTFKANDGDKLSNIILKEDKRVLSEVVVVGYGSQKRANLTGAVATISSDDINNRPVASAAGALQGADPAVNLTFNSGSMDSDYSIDIRGVASVNGGTPLVLCDGMEVSLNQINPNDIESISVLKDASASAIYGAKASSGVILITTKSGKDSDGKVNVSYNGRYAWRKNTTSTDFITTGYDHVNIVNQFYNVYQGKLMWGYTGEDLDMLEARKNDKTEDPSRPWAIDKDGKLYFYSNFDWYNYFYKTTRPEQEHNLSVTGGNKKVNYFISGRFLECR